MSFSSSFSLFGPTIPQYHVSSSVNGYLTENQEIVSMIVKTIDKRNKLQFSHSEKIKQLASSIPKQMLVNQKHSKPKLKEQQKKVTQMVDDIIKDCIEERCLLKELFKQINGSFKTILSALQKSFIAQSQNLLKSSDKMHKKLEQQITLALNQTNNQLKKMMQQLQTKQRNYEIYKKASIQAYHKYYKKWRQTQKKQIDCIILISANDTSKSKSRIRLQEELRKQCQQSYTFQQEYVQSVQKNKQSSASLLQYYEKFIPDLRKLQHNRYETIKRLLLYRQKNFCETCGISVKESQQIMAQIDVIQVEDKQFFINYETNKNLAQQQRRQQANKIQQQKYFSNSYITILYDSIIKQRAKNLIAFGWTGKTKKYKKIVENFLEAKNNGKIKESLVENQEQSEAQLITENFEIIFKSAIKSKIPFKQAQQKVQAEAECKSQEIKSLESKQQDKSKQSQKTQQKETIESEQKQVKDSYLQKQLQIFKAQMKISSEKRKIFIFCLQKFRLDGKFELSIEQRNVIKKALQIVLNQCLTQLEVINSKKLLVLSFSYYFIENQQKCYIQQLIKDHSIWIDQQWWQAAFLSSIYQQNFVIEELLHEEKSQQIKCDIQARISIERQSKIISNMKNGQNKQFVLQNLIFSNLAAFINNMAMFDIPQKQAAKLIDKYKSYISSQNKAVLQEMLKCQYKNRKKLQQNLERQ